VRLTLAFHDDTIDACVLDLIGPVIFRRRPDGVSRTSAQTA
jgi:hypothetical protein